MTWLKINSVYTHNNIDTSINYNDKHTERNGGRRKEDVV